MFVEYGLNLTYAGLSKSIDRIIESMNQESTFVLLFIPIRHEIRSRNQKKSNLKGVLRKGSINMIENYGDMFVERFREQILIRNKLVEVDESILEKFRKDYPKYMFRRD